MFGIGKYSHAKDWQNKFLILIFYFFIYGTGWEFLVDKSPIESFSLGLLGLLFLMRVILRFSFPLVKKLICW